MALSASVVWEVRSGGADTNGGAFDSTVSVPGTDFSQQAGVQIAFTDLVIGATTTQATSVAHPIVANMVGNVFQVISGGTAGFYTLLSLSGVTGTFDRSLGSAAATAVANMGGALLTVAQAVTNFVAGNTVWIKAGTFTQTTTTHIASVAGTAQTYIRGYNTTRGDIVIGSGLARPVVQTNTNSTLLFNVGTSPATLNLLWDALHFKNGASTRAAGIEALSSNNTDKMTFVNCSFDGFTIALYGDFVTPFTLIPECIACEFVNQSGSSNNYCQINGGIFDGCYFHANAGTCIQYISNSGDLTPLSINRCIFYSNKIGIDDTNTGANFKHRMIIENCDFVSNTSDAITYSQATPAVYLTLKNCIFDTNAGWDVNIANTGGVFSLYALNNAYYVNGGSGTIRRATDLIVGDITLTGSPFTAPASNDFTLNNTAGAGASCRGAAFPQTIAPLT